MKILITGATGKVGSRLTRFLLDTGYDIRLLVRRPEQADPRAEIIAGDLTRYEDLEKAVAGVDTIIHTAAAFRGVDDVTQKAVNLDATKKLAELALRAGVNRFIFASTCNVYLENQLGRPATEEDIPTGTAVYPASKIAAEQALHDLLDDSNVELVIGRFGLVYGDKDPHIAELAPHYLLQRPAQKLNSLLHHTDLDRAIKILLDTADLPHDLYNLVDDSQTSIQELLELSGLTAETTGTLDLIDKYECTASNQRFKEDFNFTFKFPSLKTATQKGTL